MRKILVSVLIIASVLSACAETMEQGSKGKATRYHYSNIEGWEAPNQKEENTGIEICYVDEGRTNTGQPCYWVPG